MLPCSLLTLNSRPNETYICIYDSIWLNWCWLCPDNVNATWCSEQSLRLDHDPLPLHWPILLSHSHICTVLMQVHICPISHVTPSVWSSITHRCSKKQTQTIKKHWVISVLVRYEYASDACCAWLKRFDCMKATIDVRISIVRMPFFGAFPGNSASCWDYTL